MIKPITKNILANESVNGPRFNFYDYTVGATYYNNGTIVDFITDGNDLYVCGIEEVTVTAPDIKDQPNLIKLISKGVDGQRGPQGAQGRPGHSPKITAKFDGKQMIIYADGNRIAVTNDLTGPSWKPERQGNTIVWNRTKDDEQPAPIDLNELRAEDYKPVLFRVDSDNTKRSDEESGPANFIQWKYEGDEFWTNLIAIDDLLNIALAGVCTWKSEEDGNWHIGHKEVVKATYDSTKDGKRIISQVELGDVLFDAGPIAPDMQIDIDYLEAKLNEIEEALKGIDIPSLDGYATEDWVNSQGFLKNIPEVDAYTKAQSDAKFQPKGNYVKSVNNHTPDANGNVTVTLGDFDLTAYVKKSDLATINGTVLYNGGNFDLEGGTVIGLQDVEVSVSNGKLRYRKKENGTWGSYTNIMDVPASTGDGDTVNGFVNVSLSGNVLTFTRQDGTTKEITLPSSGDGQGCEYCWTTETINELITSALQGYSKVTVNPRLNEGTKIATITVNGSSFDLYAPNGDGTTPTPVSGEDAISLELTNEMDTIPVDKSNKTSSTASFLTELHAFGGNNEIGFTQDDVTITISPNVSGISVVKNIDNNPKKFQINVNSGITVENQVKITFTLWANDASKSERTINYNLVPLRLSQSEMFYLEINPDIIKVDANDNYTSETVSALPHWLLDGDPQSIVGWNDSSKINDTSVKYHVYYKLDNGEYNFYTNPVNITSVENVIAFELRYYYNNNKVDYVVMDNEHVPIIKDGKNGQDGQNGNPGPIGPRGDEYEKVYGLAGNALPASKSMDATQEDANGKTSADDGYLPKFVFDGVSVNATATPQGISESNRYEYESVRRKHDGVWSSFSTPALHSNFVEAGLTDEQLENIRNDVEASVGQDLADAKQRLTDAEGRLDAIDGEGSTFLQDNASSLVQILTNYKDEDQKSFADLTIDGKKATIEQWAASKVANDLGEESLVSVKSQLDGINGVIGNYADYTEGGELKTVKQLLDAKAATAEIAATYATQESVTSARTEWNAEAVRLQSSVAKATYVWVKYDEDNNVVDVKPFDGEESMAGYEKKLSAEAMTAIRQSASEVDIIAGVADNWAQIIAKADEDGSSIVLDADHINLSGTTDATKAVIGEATITDATITNGTITSATINDCTINSSLQSANYSGVNHTGFMFDPVNNEFAIYGGQNGETRFDSTNGLQVPAANITGKLEANQIKVEDIEIEAGQITGKLTASQIDVDNLNVKVGKFDYLTVGGTAIGENNTLNIEFANGSIPSNPETNTIYFIY